MANYQIKPRNPAHSILIQLALIKLGYRWETHFDTNVRFMNAPYLFIRVEQGLIDADFFSYDYDELTFERGLFFVKGYPQLVVNSRNQIRDEIKLNGGLVGNPVLNAHRRLRDSNQFRNSSVVEELCEYILYLEGKVRGNV